MATLFERIHAQQVAVAAERVPVGNTTTVPDQATTDGLLWNYEYPNSGNIIQRAGVSGSTPISSAAYARLIRGYIVLSPRFAIHCKHVSGDFPGKQKAFILDDSTLVHYPAGEAFTADQVDTVLPPDWQDHIAVDSDIWVSEPTYTNYIPAYVPTGLWDDLVAGLPFLQMADVCAKGAFYTMSVQKGKICGPKPSDSVRRPFCTPRGWVRGTTIQWVLFESYGSSTPIFTVVHEPGKANATPVRIGYVSWGTGFFEYITGALTHGLGRNEAATETRTMTQIVNDLATATGDDPMAGSYVWPDMLQMANLTETPPADEAPSIIYVTATPSSGTAPLTSTVAIGVTGDPAPTLVVTKNDGGGATQIHNSTATEFDHEFGEGTWTLGVTATNTEGEDSDANAETVTVSAAEGGGGGSSVPAVRIGSMMIGLPSGRLVLPQP
jgi:hypothetical protein